MSHAPTTVTDVPSDLPTDPEIIIAAEATLEFRAQAWINDHAREVDDGRRQFTVPLKELYGEDESDIRAFDKSGEWDHINGGPGGYHYISDGFKHHRNAPEKAAQWDGPFEIKLVSWEVPESTSDDSENDVAEEQYPQCEVCGSPAVVTGILQINTSYYPNTPLCGDCYTPVSEVEMPDEALYDAVREEHTAELLTTPADEVCVMSGQVVIKHGPGAETQIPVSD